MEVSYGKEPFDLRLMCLRLCRNLWKILAVTVVGTLLFGGGYYVKNVVLQPDPGYAASSTYKVEYKENPNAPGNISYPFRSHSPGPGSVLLQEVFPEIHPVSHGSLHLAYSPQSRRHFDRNIELSDSFYFFRSFKSIIAYF